MRSLFSSPYRLFRRVLSRVCLACLGVTTGGAAPLPGPAVSDCSRSECLLCPGSSCQNERAKWMR